MSYGDNKMEELLSHYRKDHNDIYKREQLHQSAVLVTDKVFAEWASFKVIMSERRRLFQSSMDKKLAKEAHQNVIIQLIKQQKWYTPAAFFSMFLTISFAKTFIQEACIC